MNRRALKLHNTVANIIMLNYSVTKIIVQILQFSFEKKKKIPVSDCVTEGLVGLQNQLTSQLIE